MKPKCYVHYSMLYLELSLKLSELTVEELLMRQLVKKGMIASVAGLTVIGLVSASSISLVSAETSMSTSETDASSQKALTDSSSSLINQDESDDQASAQSASTEDTTKASKSIKSEESDSSTASDLNTVLTPNKSIGPGFYDTNQTKYSIRGKSRAATNTQSFIDAVAPGAISGWKKYQILPSVSIAQAILESGWGASTLSTKAYNLFGIKGRYNGQYVVMPTSEYINGSYVTVNAEFRKYPNWAASIEDHGKFLNVNSRYHNILGVRDYRQVTQGLHDAGYATDPNYPASLNNIITGSNLTQYDRMAIQQSNYGDIDNFTVDTNNDQLSIRGWHVSDLAYGKPYHYLFIMNADTKREILRIKLPTTSRPDVARKYPNVYNSTNSGFEYTLQLYNKLRGKRIYLKSRYSSDSTGSKSYVDFDYQALTRQVPALQNQSFMDNFYQSKNKLRVSGWHATNLSDKYSTHYLILMNADNNRELMRLGVPKITRTDVAKAHPDIKGSAQSGFDINIDMPKKLRGKRIYVISRYATPQTVDSKYVVDTNFSKKALQITGLQNKGDIDSFKQESDTLKVRGWHAADGSNKYRAHALILMNADTNRELTRIYTPTVTRTDVERVYSQIYGAEKSGFEATFKLTNKLRGKRVYVISRYYNPETGDRAYLDYRYSKNTIKLS